MAAEIRRIGQTLLPATLYELLAFGRQAWDRRQNVAAFGTVYACRRPTQVPCLAVGCDAPCLQPGEPAHIWPSDYAILCVALTRSH